MKKIGKTLLVITAGAMFPAVFFLALVGALHIFEEMPGYMLVSITMALPLGSWLIYRGWGRYE